MLVDVIDYYRDLLKISNEALDAVAGEKEVNKALILSHNYLDDYGSLKSVIENRPEGVVFNLAIKEYQFSLYALVCGQYRYAFAGLRLFFELALAAIHFSAHEISYRNWEKGCHDINWGALKDEQSGVLSLNFIRAFNPSFSSFSKQYLAIATAVYRECSEFVHGNVRTHTIIPSELVFKKDVFLSWFEKSSVIRLVVVFAFSARYLNYISNEHMNEIESIILDLLGDLQPVRDIFSSKFEE